MKFHEVACDSLFKNKENDLMLSLELRKDVAELHFVCSQGAILDRYHDAARSIFLYGYKRSFCSYGDQFNVVNMIVYRKTVYVAV